MEIIHSEGQSAPVWVQIIRKISTFFGVISAAMIAISILIICQMIWVRFVLNGSTIWQTEAVVYLMIAAVLLGLPYVQLLRGHVNVDLLAVILNPTGQKILACVSLSIAMLLSLLIAFYGYEIFHIALERNWRSDTVWGVRLWIPYLSMPVGFVLFALQLLADIAETIRGEIPENAGGH